MKASFWGAAAVAILVLAGTAAYGKEAPPTKAAPTKAESEEVSPPGNRNSAESRNRLKEQRLQGAEAKRAEDEEKLREKEKQAKIEKIQRKTGRTTISWQVQNR
jgi:hypothetical protein